MTGARQRECRGPWRTGGWFARPAQDRALTVPSKADLFPSAGKPWVVIGILLVQAVLCIRLLHANTAFEDEGLYLFTGYLQVTHQITLSQLEGLASWFSGSPEIYPPAGALAGQAGGLTGARLLSMAFLLIATGALYGVTRRLWSSRIPAIFAAAMFGWFGSTQFLGSFATYDAMALLLMVLATWVGIRAADCRPWTSRLLLAAMAICLVAANATKYMTTLYDPVVIVVVSLAIWRASRLRVALGAAAATTVAVVLLLLGAYEAAGSHYRAGIQFSTLSRTTGVTAPLQVLADAGRWIGILFLVALIAAIAITIRYRDWPTRLLSWVLALTGILSPVMQARIHTTVSLYKHVDFGAWFASIAAGWLLGYVFEAGKRRYQGQSEALVRTTGRVIVIVAVAASAVVGFVSSTMQFHDWANSSAASAELTKLATPNGEYLAEDYDQFFYEERTHIALSQWWNTWSMTYQDPQTKRYLYNDAAYADAIKHRYFSVIVLDHQDTNLTDNVIEADIKKYQDYRLVATIPFTVSSGPGDYLFWVPAK